MKIKICTALLLVWSTAFSARYAMLVGNRYGGSFQPLKYVKNDITGLQAVLTQFCGFDEANITTPIDKSAQELQSLLQSLTQNISSKDDLFLFYYSGHADHESLLMGNSRYPLADLKQQLKTLPSQIRILIFDACQSGSFTRYKGGTLEEPFLYKEENKIKGNIVLYSSSANEYSQESDLYKNSVFTFHFINALRGCADISGDKKITLSEAYQYSYNRTVSSTIHSTGGVQHPGYQFSIQGEGNVVLADITVRTCGIILDQDIEETIVVLGARKDLTADLSKEKGTRIFIAVNPGTYEIYNSRKDASYKAKIVVRKNTIVTLSNAMFRKIRTIPVYSKGAEKQRVLFGITLAGGFVDFDLSRLASQCNAQYTDFHLLSMYPSFKFSSSVFTGGLGLEINFKNNMQVYFSFDSFRLKDRRHYTSTVSSPGDSNTYPAQLQINDTFSCRTFHLRVGYTFHHRILKFITLRGGIDWLFADFTVASVFTNGLYNVSAYNTFTDNGFLILPTFGATFKYTFRVPFALGALVSYRFQTDDKELYTSKENSAPLQYGFSGVSFSLFTTYLLNRH